MAHTFASLKIFGKSDLASLVLDYQNNFDTALNYINSKLLDLKNKLTKLSQIWKFSRMLPTN